MSLEAYSKTVVKRTLAILFLQRGIVLDVPRRVRELYERGRTASKICHPQPGLNLGDIVLLTASEHRSDGLRGTCARTAPVP